MIGFLFGSEGSLAHPLYTAALAVRKFFASLSLTEPKAWDSSLWQLAGSQSLSGETVTEATALTYSAVWCAVRLISETIAALPLQLMQSDGKTKKTKGEDRRYKLLHDAPNPYMTAKAFREVQLAHLLTWGNSYAEIARTPLGDVVELWPIAPDRVTPEMRDGALVYKIRMNTGPVLTLQRERVLHIPGLGYDGFLGYSPVAMARKSIGLGMAEETFGSLYFKQGTHPGLVVSAQKPLTNETRKNLRDALADAYEGLGRANRLMLLDDGMKVEKLTFSPEDSQFLESRQFQITEIARWFNIPPHKLKDLTRSSFSNIESEQRSFYTDTLLPWLVTLEQNFNLQLLTPSDRDLSGRGRLYWKHNAKGILRADIAAQAEFYTKMFNIGAMSQNEIRALEEMDPDPNPLADEKFVPLNMVPLSMLEEKLRAEITKASEPRVALPEPDPSGGNGNGSEPKKGASRNA